MSDSIENRVKKIISQHLDAKEGELKKTDHFVDDLKADSLAVVELVLSLEEEFTIEIPDEEAEKIRTVGDAVAYIETHSS
ncbi:MAG: acyl carrier protein [Haliangiales bacterium]